MALKTEMASAGYEQDLAVWYQRQAELVRERRFHQLDLDNLIGELESAARGLRRELTGRLEVLLLHLLKCACLHQRISRRWLVILDQQRSEIENLLEENPSLAPGIMQLVEKVYPRAVHRAASETGLPRTVFPPENPYSRAQLLDLDFVP